jgi:hypothetical protein
MRWSLAVVSVVALSIAAVGCSDDDELFPGTISIVLDHGVGSDPLVFDSIQYQNAAGQDYSVETLNYYVSNFSLQRLDGSTHDVSLVHYADAEDSTTSTFSVTDVPAGDYNSVLFTFGLDDNDNVTDGLPPANENLAMKWPDPLGGGYHYMKLEGKYLGSASDTLSYATHTGRNGAVPHFFRVSLPFSMITVNNNTHSMTVSMDINEWYTNPNVYTFPVPPMIMGNVALQDTLAENGEKAFSVSVDLN